MVVRVMTELAHPAFGVTILACWCVLHLANDSRIRCVNRHASGHFAQLGSARITFSAPSCKTVWSCPEMPQARLRFSSTSWDGAGCPFLANSSIDFWLTCVRGWARLCLHHWSASTRRWSLQSFYISRCQASCRLPTEIFVLVL
jgi:hypothetical protein